MTQQLRSELPESIASAVPLFAKGYGIASEAALFLLAQTVGAVAGGSIRTTSPDLVDCTPAFDVAGIHQGPAMLHGALIAALNGALEQIATSSTPYASLDRRDMCSKRQTLERRNTEISGSIAEKEKELGRLRAFDPSHSTPEEILAGGIGSRFTTIQRLEAEVGRLCEEQSTVQKDVVDLKIALRPGIVRDRTDWRDFVTAGEFAFNGHFLQIATADSLISELGSRSNMLKACADIINRSRSESPITGFDTNDRGFRASVNLFGSDDELQTLIQHPRLKALGLLKSFVFLNIDCEEEPDVDSLIRFTDHPLHEVISALCRVQAAGACTRLQLDRQGYEVYIAFRQWCLEFSRGLAAEHRVHFLRWPELLVRIATSFAVLNDLSVEGVLDCGFLEAAGSILKAHGPRQAEILARLGCSGATVARQDAEIEGLLERLRRKGGQSRRDLARSYSGQDYAVIDTRILAAVSRGAVIQRKGLFYAADVSVNASMEPGATEMGGGVAA